MMTDLKRTDNLEVTVHYGTYESDLKKAVAESLENILELLPIYSLEDAIYFEIKRLREGAND